MEICIHSRLTEMNMMADELHEYKPHSNIKPKHGKANSVLGNERTALVKWHYRTVLSSQIVRSSPAISDSAQNLAVSGELKIK